MIRAHQPTIFPSDVVVRVSSAQEGTMLDRTQDLSLRELVANRQSFCKTSGIDYENVVFQQIIYDEKQTYSKLCWADKNHTTRFIPKLHADGIITAQSNVGIMLPIADCVPTVIYDPGTRQLAMVHLGRHSTLTNLLKKTFEQMVAHGSNIEDVLVWMGPNAQYKSYKLEYFDHADAKAWKSFCNKQPDGIYIDLTGFNRQVCLDAGVKPTHIEISPVDTYTNNNYYSHSRGDDSKRFAVVAMMQ